VCLKDLKCNEMKCRLDLDGDGCLTEAEVEAHVSAVKKGTIVLDSLADSDMKKHMKEFDLDGDGNLTLQEILTAFKVSQDRTQIMKYFVMFLIFALIISYITLGGLVYYVIQLSKESSIEKSGLMMVKGTDQVVQVGSADFTVKDGVFYSRSCSNGTCPAAAPIKTQQVSFDANFCEFLQLTLSFRPCSRSNSRPHLTTKRWSR
jgi:hypothetical protein